MYQVTRKEDDKPSGLRHVMIDNPSDDDPNAMFGQGGSFYFEPGQTLTMSEHAAGIIMRDPGLRERFTVDPPLPDEVLNPPMASVPSEPETPAAAVPSAALVEDEPAPPPVVVATQQDEQAIDVGGVAARIAAIHNPKGRK